MSCWPNVAGVFLVCLTFTNALPDEIRIGGLFHHSDDNQELAFRQAVDHINADQRILPYSKLVAQVERISPFDSFLVGKRVCDLLNEGVAAIFGPPSTHTASHVQSICDNMEIPHLENRWDYGLSNESWVVNLYPHPNILAMAYVDIIRMWGWKSFTIIYENNDGLVRLQELLKDRDSITYSITVRQLSESGDYRPLLQQMKTSNEENIVLDCSTEKVYEVLKQAQQVGMMSDYHSYLITSLDLHTVSLDEFRYGGTSITGFRLVNEEIVNEVVREWSIEEKGVLRSANLSTIKTEAALMYDAVHVFAEALHDLDTSQQIDIYPLSCDGQNTWQHGLSLINYMKIVELKGLTSIIKFDHQGFRSDFILDIVEWSPGGVRKIGEWNSNMNEGISFTGTFSQQQQEIEPSLKNKTLIVTTILRNPYCMHKESAASLSGNDQFEGYGVDLINEISKALGFSYKIQLVPDGSYGSLNKKTGKWNGMMGEIIDRRADLAVADLTITSVREQAVDFTAPFMNLGISILHHKPVKQLPNLFSFLSPLSADVWIYIAIAYLGILVLLIIFAKFVPCEWPSYTFTHGENVKNQFTPLMQKGRDLIPKALSTRMVYSIFWLFTLIMISSYTANLASFLTVERMERIDLHIESAEDLAKQTAIQYGAVMGGSTAAFFKDSKISTYQRMWSVMESASPSVFTASTSEGVDRVVHGKGNYAFLTESTSIEYVIERNCDLTQVGGLLDAKSYGIAIARDSPYRSAINSVILKLQEEGRLHILKTKWWKEKSGGGKCHVETSKSSLAANALGLADVGGVFVVLMGGMGVACLVAICEFVWKSRKFSVEKRLSSTLHE